MKFEVMIEYRRRLADDCTAFVKVLCLIHDFFSPMYMYLSISTSVYKTLSIYLSIYQSYSI